MASAITTKINGLISGLRPLRVSQSTDSRLPDCVLDNAGSDFLQTYHTLWENLHSRTMGIATRAEHTSDVIDAVHRNITRRQEEIRELRGELAELPALIYKTDQMNQQLEDILKQFSAVEGVVKELKSLDEIAELEELKRQEREAIRLKEEERERRVLMERQATFAAAFHEDLERYRQSGKVEKIDGLVVPKEADAELPELADIALEQNHTEEEALSEFLKSQD